MEVVWARVFFFLSVGNMHFGTGVLHYSIFLGQVLKDHDNLQNPLIKTFG